MNKLLLSIAFLMGGLFTQQAHAQARSSIGFGLGGNMPLQSGYKPGFGRIFQGNIRVADKWALVPAFGIESIESDKKGVYNGYYFVGSGRSVDLVFLSLAAKYYFAGQWFAYAGPSLNVGGEDAGSSGIGGSVGVGYDVSAGNHSSWEFTLRTDALPVYDKTVPVAGLRVLYKFNFRKLSKD